MSVLLSNAELIRKEFEADPSKLDGQFRALASKYNMAYATVRNLAYNYRKEHNIPSKNPHTRLPFEPPKPEWTVSSELEKRKENAVIKALGHKVRSLTAELEKTSDALDNALAIKERTDYKSQQILWNNSIKGEAAVLTQFSDWHVGKKIDKRTMNGLNEHNPDIAKQRSETCTSNLLKLIKKERQDVKINNLIINLGGDFIQNFLHESDSIQNTMSPLEEVRFAKQLLGNSIKAIAEYGDFKKIVLLCVNGNHPRLTRRMEAEVDYKMNYEFMLYNILADEFKDKLFDWQIPQSDIGYYSLDGYIMRYFHGHQVSYQGGLGGLTIPLAKKIMNWDKTKKAHWNLMSNFHTFSMPTKNCSLNGSLIGFDPYAQSLGFEYEPPTQAFQLIDKKRGPTGRFPIFC